MQPFHCYCYYQTCLTGLQLPAAAGIWMVRDPEQTLCWQTSWPLGELAPQAAQKYNN